MHRDFGVAALGIGAGQLIILAATPVLSRTYSPAEFGVYAIVSSLAGVVATVASLRLDSAIPAAESSDVEPLARTALFLPFLVVPIVVTAAHVFPAMSSRAGALLSQDLLWPVILIAILQGLVTVGLALCTRLGRFGVFAAIKMLQPLGFVVGALLVVSKLIVALALGWAAALVAAGLVFHRLLSFREWAASVTALKRAWRYPIFSAPVALLDTLTVALPVLFIAATYGEGTAGNYSQVQRLIGAPLSIAGMAVGQVFFKHAGDLYRGGGDISVLLFRTVKTLGLLAAGMAIATYSVGEPLLRLILGGDWRTDSYFIMLTLLPVLCRVTVSPISSVFLIVGRVGLGAAWQVGYFVVTFSVLFWAQKNLELEGLLLCFIFTELIMYVAYLALAVVATRPDRIRRLYFSGNR